MCFLIVIAVCVSGIGYFDGVAVSEVPPLVDFVSGNGRTFFTADMITRGEEVFHLRGLTSSGSFLGAGSERGPNYTAKALHVMAVGIVQHYQTQMPNSATQFMLQAAEERVPTTDVVAWSLLAMVILFLSLFITFFVHGQFKSDAYIKTYKTCLATDAAGSGGALAGSMAVGMSVYAVLSGTDSMGKSHIVMYTQSTLAE